MVPTNPIWTLALLAAPPGTAPASNRKTMMMKGTVRRRTVQCTKKSFTQNPSKKNLVSVWDNLTSERRQEYNRPRERQIDHGVLTDRLPDPENHYCHR